jgi:hypothetical protein
MFNTTYPRLNAKYQIDSEIDVIDKNRFVIKLEALRNVLEILSCKDKHVPEELYNNLTSRQRIASFNALEDNWDSYGAVKVPKKTVESALAFYNKLGELTHKICFVYPTVDGKVGMDFKNSKNRIEVRFFAVDNYAVTLLNDKKNAIEHKHFTKAASVINYLNSMLNE